MRILTWVASHFTFYKFAKKKRPQKQKYVDKDMNTFYEGKDVKRARFLSLHPQNDARNI